MTGFLIAELAILLFASSAGLLIMAVLFADERNQSERARVDHEVRLAEAKVHDLTRKMLMAMLDEMQWHR
jgi:hypothetical protein